MKYIIIIFISISSTNSFSQQWKLYNSYIEDTLQITEVYKADTISYFGIDFSHMELVNPFKVGTEKAVLPYVTRWLTSLDKAWNHDNYMSWMVGKQFSNDFDKTQKLYLKREDNWISSTRHPLILDSIQKIINSYEINEQTNKIGFVIIVETLFKSEETAIVDYVFFDIKTRAILYRVQIEGNTDGYGMTNRWENAISSSIRSFCNFHASRYKRYKKIEKKHR